MTAPPITFSLKPFTLRDVVLLDRVKKGDTQAAIELIVRRADPPVSETVIGDLTMAEATDVIARLGKSLEAVDRLNTLVGETLKGVQ